MKMWAGRLARKTQRTDDVSLLYALPRLNLDAFRFEVFVKSNEIISYIYGDIISCGFLGRVSRMFRERCAFGKIIPRRGNNAISHCQNIISVAIPVLNDVLVVIRIFPLII